MYHSLLMMKWLMSNVLPGFADVLASPLWLQSMFIRLDLPTFDRPMNAYSFFVSLGHFDIVGDDMLNSEVFIIMSVDLLHVVNYLHKFLAQCIGLVHGRCFAIDTNDGLSVTLA